jgi:hypothetical protein
MILHFGSRTLKDCDLCPLQSLVFSSSCLPSTDVRPALLCLGADRFLPDKAIDLVDEACANVRVQLDSQPEEIDKLERRKMQLEVRKLA